MTLSPLTLVFLVLAVAFLLGPSVLVGSILGGLAVGNELLISWATMPPKS